MSAALPGTTAAVLVAWYERDDDEGVVAAYPHLTDDVRVEAWERLAKPLAKASLWTPQDRALPHNEFLRRVRTRSLLALAVGPPEVARIVGTGIIGVLESDAIIATRPATWRSAFASTIVHEWASEREVGLFGPMWWDWWRWIRRQERDGLLPIDPSSADYLVVMVRGLLFGGSIVDAVREDPALAAGSVWSLFEPEPAVQRALLGSERFWNPANTWRVALVLLALAGDLDGERLERAAMAAAEDPRMGSGHRAWYRKIPDLLRNPAALPSSPEHGAPPPGNQLYPRIES